MILQTGQRSTLAAMLGVGLLLLLGRPLPAQTTKLTPETIKAFDQYVEVVEEMIQKRLDGEKPFLWLDDDPRSRARLLNGTVLVHQFEGVGVEIPGGLIHDWIGAMFIPGGTVKETLSVIQDYDRHKEIYPEVIDSKLLERDGNVYRGYLKFLKKKVLTAVLNTEHRAEFFELSEGRWHSQSYTTRIAEVRDAGKPDEKELPVGEDSGFLWRLYAYWRMEQDDDGVYAELQTLSLTRRVPSGLGWLINPFIKNMPRNSLEGTLQATRVAVKQ